MKRADITRTTPLDPEEDAAWRALARAVLVVPKGKASVMRYGGVARANLDRSYPGVFSEWTGNDDQVGPWTTWSQSRPPALLD